MDLNVLLKKQRLLEQYGTEQVFVVPYFLTQDIPDGYTKLNKDNIDKYNIDILKGKYILRAEAEENIVFQQVIPCAVIFDEDNNVYVSKRIKGDPRLSGSLSITFGGHINPCDGLLDPINKSLERELSEEINFSKIPKESYLDFHKEAYVRDLKSNTSEHIGVIYFIKIPNKYKKRIKIKEKNTLIGKWMNKEQLMENYNKFESWARLIINEIVVSDSELNKYKNI